MAEPGFLPRKEFIREVKPTHNVFAILAIAGANFLRLYSFPPSVISALRRLLDSYGLLVFFREHTTGSLFEFTLDGKPWSNAKSVTTEKLLLDILAIIYDTGYSLVSTLDYGRESDDRLAIAFSKLEISPSTSRVGTPVPVGPQPGDSGTHLPSDRLSQTPKRTPFALSFTSSTCMRVIAPPLHLTPAILQAVRGSWPRGVVSEKKVGDNSFEFKLKGYKWFQQDTFATDSLRHILSLLSSLDAQSFTLVSSICLTGRSRVKDLWIFTGPGTQSSSEDLSRHDSPAHGTLPEASRPRTHSPNASPHQAAHLPHFVTQHRRLASEPVAPVTQDGTLPSHVRAATDQPIATPISPNLVNSSAGFGQSLQRKPAPRAQIPVSVVGEADELEQVRADMPSVISSNADDMTGVGATGYATEIFYSTPSPRGPVQPFHEHTSATRPPRALRPVSARAKTPPLLVSSSSPESSSRQRHHIPVGVSGGKTPPSTPPLTSTEPRWVAGQGSPDASSGVASAPADWDASSQRPPLLGSKAFRDSAFSGSSETSSDIPIKWTGIGEEQEQITRENSMKRRASGGGRKSPGDPKLPGAWQATPIEEKPEENSSLTEQNPPPLPFGPQPDTGHKTPVLEVSSRVSTPEVANGLARKSEAALVDMIADSAPVPPVPELPSMLPPPESPGTPGGQGWVLVNVGAIGTEATIASAPARRDTIPSPRPPIATSNGGGVVSPQAKAIAIQDAIKSKRENKPPTKQGSADSSGSVKRFFSLNRKDSKKITSGNTSKEEDNHKPKAGFRDRLRLIGMTEASRNEGKRRSID